MRIHFLALRRVRRSMHVTEGTATSIFSFHSEYESGEHFPWKLNSSLKPSPHTGRWFLWPPLTATLHRLSLTLNTMNDDGYPTPLTLLVPFRSVPPPPRQFHFRLGFIIWSSDVEHFSHDWGCEFIFGRSQSLLQPLEKHTQHLPPKVCYHVLLLWLQS